MNTLEKVKLIYEAALDKKAQEGLILHVENLAKVTDYFMIFTAANSIQAQAVANSVLEKLDIIGEKPLHTEGYRESLWILLDCGDVVIHIMQPEFRNFYMLEKLWGDAPKITV